MLVIVYVYFSREGVSDKKSVSSLSGTVPRTYKPVAFNLNSSLDTRSSSKRSDSPQSVASSGMTINVDNIFAKGTIHIHKSISVEPRPVASGRHQRGVEEIQGGGA